MKPLRRPARRALVVVHVAVSVSWLGLSLGLLALGVTAYGTADASLTEAAYRAMKVFSDWLLPPIALTTLVSGLLLALGTPWGLARHRWVWIKFWLTLATTAATLFALRPEIAHAAAVGVPDSSLVAAPAVSTSAYLFMTAISLLKPWGPTRRGRRLRESQHGRAPGRRTAAARGTGATVS
ncbi:DUF2269 domain-containing protein [Streptomyces coeruleoprunus]|uniref:DUF2269 domain-containing protein n=1 Tax=Streptomyces coeruleoprunus TaxID=285563 RepID=A0ABV9XB24_9ACTN